jgi:hypothetical protein
MMTNWISEVQGAKSNKRIMVWMCLERCGFTKNQIQEQIKQIADNKDLIWAVSFEKYNLGPNGTLVVNNLTDVTRDLQQLGLETFPMVSSFPYPPNVKNLSFCFVLLKSLIDEFPTTIFFFLSSL